ncbi:hypothetical protein [Spirillospora sp. CA-128828]|uniref:hypothetical protein n=1 Tax=Spirillospora sp. CA-128828 TaxID=3240033 RepID=UPI003D8DD641
MTTEPRHPRKRRVTPAVTANALRAGVLGRASYAAAAAERRERFAQLRRGGYTIQQAAWELGVTRRTADRYAAQLRKQAA